MVDCILVADSGSTKTDWMAVSTENGILEFKTTGINPVRDSQNAILSVLGDELVPHFPSSWNCVGIYFYGAGCIHPYADNVRDCLRQTFCGASVTVDTDMLGAARALCGNNPGIACIMGTGSNSCYYDGSGIVGNIPPLGYILGDEGSGAVLGRTLVCLLLKGVLPSALRDKFLKQYGLTAELIIENVYRKPLPNRFLASFAPFIADHREESGIHEMLVSSFRLFFSHNVKAYGHPEMPVDFVGSIAYVFKDELETAASLEGLKIGKILRSPIEGIAGFHGKV